MTTTTTEPRALLHTLIVYLTTVAQGDMRAALGTSNPTSSPVRSTASGSRAQLPAAPTVAPVLRPVKNPVVREPCPPLRASPVLPTPDTHLAASLSESMADDKLNVKQREKEEEDEEGEEEDQPERGERMPGDKRTVAMHVCYVGTKFRGLQLSRDFPADTTVEGVLERALLQAGLIAPSNFGDLFKIKWTRSSRTDKGVHSLATVIGCRLVIQDSDDKFTADPEGLGVAALINAHLPSSTRVLSVQRVNKKFNARRFCMGRSYEYLMPASVLGLKCDGSEEDQRILSEFRGALNLFLGKHPFHNFTVRRKQYLVTPATKAAERAAAAAQAVQDLNISGSGADVPQAVLENGADGLLAPTAVVNGVVVKAAQEKPGWKKGRRKGADDDVVDDEAGDEELDVPTLQAELEAELALVQDDDGVAAQGEVVGVVDAGAPVERVRRWRQLCYWQGEMSDRDRVGVRHYRVIKEFTADDPAPLVPGGVPCLRLRVSGLSFMLNQIRHMIGAAVAVACGHMSQDLLKASLSAPSRVSVPKAPPHSLALAGVSFPPFRGAGTEEAKVARFSGQSLTLREGGQTSLQEFREQILAPELNTLLSHTDWQYFKKSLEWFYWDPEAVEQVIASHAAWQLQRQAAGKHKGAARGAATEGLTAEAETVASAPQEAGEEPALQQQTQDD